MNRLAAKPTSASEVEMTQLVLPQHTNARGTAFGGTIVSWVDIAAATCAMRHAQMGVVTASIDAMHFLAPVKLGWVVKILAAVNFTGTTSCEVGVKIQAENPISGLTYHTATAYVTLVSLDDNDRPTRMPPVISETEEQKKRQIDAELRRESRLALREKIKKKRLDSDDG